MYEYGNICFDISGLYGKEREINYFFLVVVVIVIVVVHDDDDDDDDDDDSNGLFV
jgi:hypothetical protein